jgi:hypothetical protein
MALWQGPALGNVSRKSECTFLIALCVLFGFIFLMQNNKPRPKKTAHKESAAKQGKDDKPVATPTPLPDVPAPDAFLTEAKNEPKRKLITDHIRTITVLRDEKRFTFRQIAEWLTDKGVETDHSSVYRAYMAAVPDEQRDPITDWQEFETPE